MKSYRASARALEYNNSKFLATAKAIVARNLRGAFKEASLTRPHLLALLLLKGTIK